MVLCQPSQLAGFGLFAFGEDNNVPAQGDNVYMLFALKAGIIKPTAAKGNARKSIIGVIARLAENGLYFEAAGIGHQVEASLLQYIERPAQLRHIGKGVFYLLNGIEELLLRGYGTGG